MEGFVDRLKAIGNAITEQSEISQGRARLTISLIFFVYFAVLGVPAAFVAGGVAGISILWLWWIRDVPTTKHRLIAGNIIDNVGVTTVMWLAGPHHPGLFLMYFWLVIGSGYRFGPRYGIYSMILTLVMFWIMLLWSAAWTGHMLEAVELTFGFVLISTFAYRLLENLDDAICEAKSQEKRADDAENKSKRDGLTGLCNRESAFDWLTQHANNNARVGVLFLDLDNFKHFNDDYGHHVGDEVLINISKRLKRSVKDGDVVCRYAGDEFIIIVDDEDHATIERVAQRISDSLNQPIGIDDNPSIAVTGSIGIAILGIHGDTPNTVLRNADAAMYMAKRLGRNQVAWYEEKIGS